MSEERLQEIKDSVKFQYILAKAKGYDNALLFTNEEEELIEEVERLNKENEHLRTALNSKESIIKEAREYITSYDSISTIQGLENIEANKGLDEKTLNEMVRRYMILHDKLLKILDKENI